jgi:hypothetical protein
MPYAVSSFLKEKLKKENLDNFYLETIKQVKSSKNTFFTPYKVGVNNFLKADKRVILSTLAVVLSLDKLILLGGIIGAAVYAVKGVSELLDSKRESDSELLESKRESANESFAYAGALLKASLSLTILMYIDVLNMVTRVLATIFGIGSKTSPDTSHQNSANFV